jgi:Zn-dependent protease/CBS domain-containing protein
MSPGARVRGLMWEVRSMRQSVHLGRIAGIRIGAHWSVLFIVALLAYVLAANVLPGAAPGQTVTGYGLVAVVLAALFLAGLLAHELAHALVARHYGIGVKRITLWLLGGVSELDGETPTPRAELLVAAAGPLTSLVLGVVAGAASVLLEIVGVSRLVVVGLAWLAWVNVILCVFNLLPGAPLDGGRVLHAGLWKLRRDRYAAQVAADRAGVGLGVALAVVGLLEVVSWRDAAGLWLVLLGWFLIGAARAETAAARVRQALGSRRVRDIMTTEPVYGLDGQSVESFVAEHAVRRPHGTYPVVDLTGRPVGMVRLPRLLRIPAARRAELRLAAVATPLTDDALIGPDDAAWNSAQHLSAATPLVAVADQGQLVGVVSTRDIQRALGRRDPGPSSIPRSV